MFVHDLYSAGRDTSTYKVKFSNLYIYVPVHVSYTCVLSMTWKCKNYLCSVKLNCTCKNKHRHVLKFEIFLYYPRACVNSSIFSLHIPYGQNRFVGICQCYHIGMQWSSLKIPCHIFGGFTSICHIFTNCCFNFTWRKSPLIDFKSNTDIKGITNVIMLSKQI